MIVRQVSLKVAPARQPEFVAFWKDEYRAAMSRQPGFVSASLLRSSESPEDLQLTLCFAGEEQAAAWRASPDHARLGPRLKGFCPAPAVKVFTPLD